MKCKYQNLGEDLLVSPLEARCMELKNLIFPSQVLEINYSKAKHFFLLQVATD